MREEALMNDFQRAKKTLEQSIKSCVELGLSHFQTASGSFPQRITVELGALADVNNIEIPKVTVSVE
jgi:hypothetical protein